MRASWSRSLPVGKPAFAIIGYLCPSLWHIWLVKEVDFLELEAASLGARRTQLPSDEKPGNSWHALNFFDRLELALPQSEAR